MLEKTERDYNKLVSFLIKRKISISTMESCTSGLIASFITDTDHSSEIFFGGYVTYSNEMKVKTGVPEETIKKYGVYSEETAIEMAKTCRRNVGTEVGVGVTGSLGIKDPNNSDSVPGTVYSAIVYENQEYSFELEAPFVEDKHKNKLYIADEICIKLMKVLGCDSAE